MKHKYLVEQWNKFRSIQKETQNSFNGINIPSNEYKGYDNIEEDVIKQGKKDWNKLIKNKVLTENEEVQTAYKNHFFPAFNLLNKQNPTLKEAQLAMKHLKDAAYIISKNGNSTGDYATFDTIEVGKWSTIIDKIKYVINKSYNEMNELRQSIVSERRKDIKERKQAILLYMYNTSRSLKQELKILISEMGDHIDSKSDELHKKEDKRAAAESVSTLNNLEITI